jgi:hypothetical protein
MLGGKGTPRTVLGSPSYLVVWHCHDVQGLDDGDQRAFAGMVSALDSSIEAFRSGQGQNGWTSTHVADLVSRLCDAEVGGYPVMP